MPESTSLKRNTDDEVLPQGYSTELADWKEVIVDEEGKQYVRDTEVLAKLTEMDNKLQTLEDTVDTEGNQKVQLNGNIVEEIVLFDAYALTDAERVFYSELESTVDVSRFRDFSFVIGNTHDADIDCRVTPYVNGQRYSSLRDGEGNNVLKFTATSNTISSSIGSLYNLETSRAFSSNFKEIDFRIEAQQAPSEGSITVVFIGVR